MNKFAVFISVLIYVSNTVALENILHYVIDDVPAGSYKYYSLMYEGLIKIRLTTQSGDADIYVSQTNTKPTYEPDKYCLQSTTCGEDIVYIPQSFKRPVSIGVYGHPSHEISRYTLLVYQVIDVNGNFFDEQNTDSDSFQRNRQSKKEKTSVVLTLLWSLIDMLEYENQMFLEILQEDGLVIAAKGLGIERVFMNILKAYSDPGQLVIALGTNDFEEQYFIEQLKMQGVTHLPRVVTGLSLSDEREIIYLEGGVLFMSGRIFVVDLLKNRVPLNLVSGILVYRAHTILNSHQEAFALRLYRKTNKSGFIKAFTNSALAFTIGSIKIEQVMKKLFVKKLYLYPRFHFTVKESLNKYQTDVSELHVELTPKMTRIQIGLLDVMNYVVQELKKQNKYLDLEELTVENAVAKKFHKQLQLQLDPIWDQLSFKSKQLVSDLGTQRSLLMCLTHQDCVSFYAMLSNLRTMEYTMKSSGWTVLDIVDDMFENARLRVFSEKGDIDPEPNPKWIGLSEILIEIRRDCAKNKKSAAEKVLILTQNGKTCGQLKNYLTMGAKDYLRMLARRILKPDKGKNINKPETSSKTTKGSKTRSKTVQGSKDDPETDNTEKDEDEDCDSYVLTQKISENDDEDNSSKEKDSSQYFDQCSQLAELDLTTLSAAEPLLVIQSFKKGGDSMSLHKTLEEMKPTYVVIYTAEISTIRQLEVYQNKNPSISLKVFFLLYGDSVEEQAYLTSMRREKEAFEKLIAAKTTMVIPTEQDGKLPESTSISNETEPENTRKGGLKEDQVETVNKIIVDTREFRSELPSMLHQRDIEIEPVTILVGDYILSPDICVERKSIADLIGSLHSGRLYNQCVAMTRYYSKPMLLIEFDANQPFGLQGKYFSYKEIRGIDLTRRLQLLTIYFPKLKLVWSPSPHATAQLFEELKQGRLQPDAAKAAQIGADDNIEDESLMAEKYNCQIQDFIAKLPGVHSKNLRHILNKGRSLDHLLTLSKDELTEIVFNKADAELLYNALHSLHKPPVDASASSSSKFAAAKFKKRGLFFKKPAAK